MSLEAVIVAAIERVATEFETRVGTTEKLGGVKAGGVPMRYPIEDWAGPAEMWVDPSTGVVQSYYLGLFLHILSGWMDEVQLGTLDPSQRIIRGALHQDVLDSLNKADSAILNLTERNVWAPSTSYAKGDVVTSQYARWYCKTAHTSAATWAETNWIHLGLYAVGATSDPGVSGRLWVEI